MKRIHERLLTGVRGEEKRPGEFRKSQNWIGSPAGTLEQAAYVPPRHDPERLDALRDWESFLNEDLDLPPLVAAGLAASVAVDPRTGEFELGAHDQPQEDGGGLLLRWEEVEYLEFIDA